MLRNSRALFIVIQLSWVVGSAFGSNSHELETRLSQSVASYHLSADNFADGLIHVADEFRIPLGIQWINTPAAKSTIDLSWKASTVREILESVVNTQPGYEMAAASDGVLHVFPTSIATDQNFLAIRISSFEVHHEIVEIAERRLKRLVQLARNPPKSSTLGIGGSLAANVDEPTIDVHLSGATVEDNLDALLLASEKKIWVVTFTESPALTTTGLRHPFAVESFTGP